jgi:hypothetical protein
VTRGESGLINGLRVYLNGEFDFGVFAEADFSSNAPTKYNKNRMPNLKSLVSGYIAVGASRRSMAEMRGTSFSFHGQAGRLGGSIDIPTDASASLWNTNFEVQIGHGYDIGVTAT